MENKKLPEPQVPETGIHKGGGISFVYLRELNSRLKSISTFKFLNYQYN
jgi:hypothetical protein